MQHADLSRLLQQGDFGALFRRMGWDNPEQGLPVDVAESALRPVAVADKRGVTAWRVDCPNGLPKRSEQHRVVRHLKRHSRDQLVVFVAPDRHLWLWPEQRPSGVGYRLVDHEYPVEVPTDALLQRLTQAAFKIEEEMQLTSSAVLDRVRRSFNADKVTKSFYREFQQHHKNFAMKVEGIPTGKDRRWYASVLLNRLMFIYFIQKKRFLADDENYLRSRLAMVHERCGADQFYAFYKRFLLPLFHTGLGKPQQQRTYDDAGIEEIIGTVPYVNGGIFEPHDLEKTHDIQIKDEAFEALFGFFDDWRWHLDENPTGEPNEINPDILGFIFEQYINFTEAGQKEKGAYYTKPDVTGYMAASTILPALADRFVAAGLDDPCILLSGSDDTYIHDSILHGVDQPLPDGWDTGAQPPSDELALPGERWCDVTHRRDRCGRLRELLSDQAREWTIDDAITENLDMRGLLADYLSQLSTAAECDTAFNALRSLTVCDPTVGSGAFLFAALEVLDPLYEAVLGRAAELHDKNDDGQPADCLAQARQHESERYWMLKTLCLNNLYGVDLMDEAPEIAKLRLFLKLAAQIDNVDLVEPLPDLDFNIKAGNLLVGIADNWDAEERLSGGRLDLGGEIAEIKAIAERVADAYDEFTDVQSRDTGKSDHTSAKQTLTAQLEAARALADALLHRKREESPNAAFESWRNSHRPFHWFVEFPSVWRNSGFDVVIGNPPYIKTSEISDYRWIGYKTQNCPDLYAPCVERASMLINDQGRMSMIVMHSLCFSKNFVSLRSHLSYRFPSLWISSYSRIPDGLFSGSARVRNSVLIGAQGSNSGLHTSSCRRWLTEFRPALFNSVEYVQPSSLLLALNGEGVWPFVDSQAVSTAFSKLVKAGRPLSRSVVRGAEHQLAYKRLAQYMLGVSEEPPPTRGGASTQRYGFLTFTDTRIRVLALIMLAGRWGYLWWMIFSDEFDVTRGTLSAFPGDMERLAEILSPSPGFTPAAGDIELVRSLVALSSTLRKEMPKHLAWKWNAGIQVGRYNMLGCRHITDEADLLLARIWGIEHAYEAAGNLRDRTIFGNRE